MLYIVLVTINTFVVAGNIFVSLNQNETLFIAEIINIAVCATIVFIYLFYLFGLLDTYTELSNLESVKLERATDTVEGILFLESKDEMFIKQVDNSEVIIVNKNLTEVISYSK